eukprot:10357735-Ditylum_brightwellii.AAC.1
MMTVTETIVMKLEILPQSLVVLVVNNHEADNKNNEADSKNKDNANDNHPILASLPVENRPSCRWPVVWEGGRIVNVTCTELGLAFQWHVTSDGGKFAQNP